MSVSAKRELLFRMQSRYAKAGKKERGEIIDGFIAATGYHRKYAISLLRGTTVVCVNPATRQRKRNYDDAVRQALESVWIASGQLCSKRLAPFLGEFVSTLERFGHIALPSDVREKLIKLSPATIDRLLKKDREKHPRGVSTTKPANLLKQRIKVRTFAEWNETGPGFFEGDLVAHCGDTAEGSFLNSLVITDIFSGWIEFAPILRKCEADVIAALDDIRAVLPMALLGLDTDNGSEFINHELLSYCEREKITFTRSRAYKKNDQAHIEQKNGSVIRRIVGYDRYEGTAACNLLLRLYRVLRLYVNFFQPSTKLLKKERTGSRTSKHYDKAKTPFRRLLESDRVSKVAKDKLQEQYNSLDPVQLFELIGKMQERLWREVSSDEVSSVIARPVETPQPNLPIPNPQIGETRLRSLKPQRKYRRSTKARVPVTWRTRQDPFDGTYEYAKLAFQLEPHLTAKDLFKKLQNKFPEKFSGDELRTFQRRVSKWRKQMWEAGLAKGSLETANTLDLAEVELPKLAIQSITTVSATTQI